MIKATLIFLGLLGLVNCAQKSVQPSPEHMVQRFDSQLYFLDKQKNKSHQMRVEVVALRNQKMRLDAKVTLGLHVASALMTRERVQVALHSEKKYYEGLPSTKAMERSIGLPLHPLLFHAMVYRQGLKGQGWNCAVHASKLQKCEQARSGLEISWEDQDGATMVVAESRSFQLQWRIFRPESVEERANYFELKVPESYKKLSL